MKKKTFKKVLNAQLKLAGSGKMVNYKFVSAARVLRVAKFALRHDGRHVGSVPIGQIIKDVCYSDGGIVKRDGTIYVARILDSQSLFTDY